MINYLRKPPTEETISQNSEDKHDKNQRKLLKQVEKKQKLKKEKEKKIAEDSLTVLMTFDLFKGTESKFVV